MKLWRVCDSVPNVCIVIAMSEERAKEMTKEEFYQRWPLDRMRGYDFGELYATEMTSLPDSVDEWISQVWD